MLSVPSDGAGFPRVCPVCGEESDSLLCERDGVKTFSLKTVAGRFVRLKGDLAGSELLRASKFGYDLRVDTDRVKDWGVFKEELVLYFTALEELYRPRIVVFSRDHRRKGELFQQAFETYARECGLETCVVGKPVSTTMSPYLGAMFSFLEKKPVMALHSTASHNPPNYNGVKVHAGRFDKGIFPDGLEFSETVGGEVVESYVRWCTQFSPYGGELSIDLSNGAGVIPLPPMASRLFPRARFFNDRLLQDFGGLRPEPGWTVSWKGFGVAFDGDADRCPFYMDSRMIFFSRFLSGMVKEGLFRARKVVADQRTPPSIIGFLESCGVKVVVGNIGNTNQSIISRRENALWFEENWHSGGYPVDGNRFYWGEAPFAVAFWLDKLKVSPERLLEGVPAFEYREERFQVAPGFNSRVVEFAEKKGMDYSTLPTGGLRLEEEDGHILFRESNTEIGTAKVFVTGSSPLVLEKKLAFARKLIASMER